MIKVALVTHGYRFGGGVPTMTRFLREQVPCRDIQLDMFDLSTTWRHPNNRLASNPRTWGRELESLSDDGIRDYGANFAELEVARYLPRHHLTRRLNEYDLVHVSAGGPVFGNVVRNVQSPVILQIASIGRWERAEILASMQGIQGVYWRASTKIVGRLEASAVRTATLVLALNPNLVDEVLSLGQPQVRVAYPGVDTDRFSPTAPPGNRDGPVVSVGRFGDPRKGFDRLIAAYQKCAETVELPKLVIAGKGRPPRELRALAEQSPSEQISFVSDISQFGLVDLLQSASLYVQPSHEEGLGIAVIEAMACGAPVVATDTAGTRLTVVDGVTGRLVAQSVDVIDRLAAAMLEGMSEVGDRWSVAGRIRAITEFSNHTVTNAYRDLYREMAGGVVASI